VQVKSLDSHLIRTLLAARAGLVAMHRDVANQIRGALKTIGLVLGKVAAGTFEAHVRQLIAWTLQRYESLRSRPQLENGATFAARVLKPDDLRQRHLRLFVSHHKADGWTERVGLTLKQAAYTVLRDGIEQPATEYENFTVLRFCDEYRCICGRLERSRAD
jgi:transposase